MPDRVPSFHSTAPTEIQPIHEHNMEYQYQTPALDSLMVAKKRKDSAADDPSPQSPASSGILNRRLDSSLAYQSFSNNGSPIRSQDSHVTHMEARIFKNFDTIDASLMRNMNIETFSDYIARERLSSMPHRGSLWDRVLRWAEFYALQIDNYAQKIESFVPESQYATKQIYTLLRSIINLGEANASALNTTFSVFYKLGLSLSFLSSHETQLSLSTDVREDVSRAFRDIHFLVFDVASHYQGSVRGLSHGAVTLDFTLLFREHLNNFENRKNRIVNHIWSHALGGDAAREVHEVRKWLDQRAFLLRSISAESLTYASHYDEYTCEWFQQELLNFTRGDQKILAITGPPGCGKSVLSSWIQERLQRRLSQKTHSTVIFSFNSDVPSETTSLALSKSLALQLMDIRLGNVRMFEAIVQAFNSKNPVDMEHHLWKAIDAAFSDSSEPTMIIIDGLDQLRGDRKQVCERMSKLSTSHRSLQAIILSRTDALPRDEMVWKAFKIQPDHVYDDIKHIAKHKLRDCVAYHKKNDADRQKFLDQLVKKANGSFLWLLLAVIDLKPSKLPEDLDENFKSLKVNLDEMIEKRVSFDKLESDVKLLISIMMATERPLSIDELYDVLQVDLQKKTNTHRAIDLRSKFANTSGWLRHNNAGFVKFSHPAVREYFLALQVNGEKLLPHKEAHTNLTLRLLVYSKACLSEPYDVSLEPLPQGDVERLFTEHDLLEYAVRNWTIHFRQSNLFKPTGTLGLSNDVQAAFPSSPVMPLLEWTCWDAQFTTNELLPVHELALRIRSEVFQDKHVSTLQTSITCAYVFHMYSSPDTAAPYFVRASRICQHVLPKHNRITVTLTETFLTITDSMTFTSRTELVTLREEMLKFIITAYKETHGETSDVVIRFTKTLAEMYVSIHEEDHAAACWKELRIVIVKKYGEGSDFEREISGKLMVVLKADHDHGEIEPYRYDIFSVGDDSAVVWNLASFQMFLKLARGCEHRKEFYEAEELYVTLWTRLLGLCRSQHSHDVETRISMLQVAVEYVYFLTRQQRKEEAKNMLIVLWTEHKHFGCESETFYQQLIIIGKLMRSLELHNLSISVFERVSNFFKAVGKHESSYARECEETMIKVIQETSEKQSSSSSRSESTDEMQTIVRRMFNSSTLSQETIKVARSAVQMYMKQENWSEAISLLTKTLDLMHFTGSWGGGVCLPDDYADESIEFALELGKCYTRSKRHSESLAVYLQLWQAVRSSCSIDDKRRTVILDVIVQNYTEHKRWRALVELHKDLLLEYRRYLGKSHERIIGLLYFLGDLTLEHGYGYAEDYYREIVDVIGTPNTKLSFKAYKRLSQIYYDESNWVELRIVCDVLWNLLTTQTKEYDYDENYVELLYIRYTYVLKHHNRNIGKADHKLLVLVAKQYRDICITKFGTSSSVAIRARIKHASILMEDESTKVEAVAAYEEIITTTKSSKIVVDEKTMSMVKSRMTEAYVHVHRKGITSAETTEKAIAVLQERLEQLKSSQGCAHSETLSILSELVSMCYKTKKTAEEEHTIIRMLQENTLEIITKERRSQVLFEAANTLGAMYITCGYHTHGLQLVQAVRRQIITGHAEAKSGVQLDKSIGRVAFVFLVTFELTLKGSSGHNYSEVMADWLTESVSFNNYSRCLATQVKTEQLLLRSAHLRHFWHDRSRHEEIQELDQHVFEVFNKQFGNALKTRPETIKIFLTSLLVHIGSADAYDIQAARAASIAGDHKIEALVLSGKHQEAIEVAYCTFQFVMTQDGYQQAGLIGYGFKLAKYLTMKENIPTEIHTKMLQASREIMAEVLNACKTLEINFLQLHDHELNDLVELLGQQENYKELDTILESLWRSRSGQKNWSEDTLINLGECLVVSRHLASDKGHSHRAIHLAEDITYNLRRVLGGLHPHTLKMSNLLSQLYTSANLHGEALNVHEEILQLIVSGDDGEDHTTDTVSADTARQQVDLLKAAYQRNGGWVKSAKFYKDLVTDLTKMFSKSSDFKDLQPIKEWQAKPDNTTASKGVFQKPQRWIFIVEDDIPTVKGGRHIHSSASEEGFQRAPQPIKKGKQIGWSFRRASDRLGMRQQRTGRLDAEITI